jgi:hypothetical protein
VPALCSLNGGLSLSWCEIANALGREISQGKHTGTSAFPAAILGSWHGKMNLMLG